MRVWEDGVLTFNPQIPDEWESYSFTINFRGNIIKVYKSKTACKFFNESNQNIKLRVNNSEVYIPSNQLVTI
jgi:maltose phosphorylase